MQKFLLHIKEMVEKYRNVGADPVFAPIIEKGNNDVVAVCYTA